MKKLLALMLVLGMATAADAALSLRVYDDIEQTWIPAVSSEISLLPTETIMLGVYNDAPLPGGFVASLEIPAPGNISDPDGDWTGAYVAHPYAAPFDNPSASLNPWGYITYQADYWAMANSNPSIDELPAGIQFEFEFHCNGIIDDGPVTILLKDGGVHSPITQELIIHQLPEPMSMALLGLGGLGLLRRRR